jgi:hypothetical protein
MAVDVATGRVRGGEGGEGGGGGGGAMAPPAPMLALPPQLTILAPSPSQNHFFKKILTKNEE